MDRCDKESGIVFNIQKYSLHDGPGIRTIVFLKGCPLRCSWCSNPESQKPKPQLAYNANKCLSLETCVRCVEVCAVGAIKSGESNRVQVDRKICNDCLACVGSCPSQALNFYGETMTVAEVIRAVEEDAVFYSRSGGGLTLSGGEPMAQPGFAIAILKEARKRRIHTAMETCGQCPEEDLETACRHLNILLFDIKTMDPEKHEQYTGVSNSRILKNLLKIRTLFPELPILVRTPVIPGINDQEEDILRILQFIQDMPNVRYELLPFHRMGKPKYEYLGNSFPMSDEPLDDKIFRGLYSMVSEEFTRLLS